MFRVSAPGQGERVANAIASRVASWWFPTLVLVGVGIWSLINVVSRPIEPYPVVVLAWISAVLATVAACQGPLILLSQRRAALHDRERDEEVFRVAVNSEADLHTIVNRLDSIDAKLSARDR